MEQDKYVNITGLDNSVVRKMKHPSKKYADIFTTTGYQYTQNYMHTKRRRGQSLEAYD